MNETSELRVRDIMTPHVETIQPDLSVREASARMKQLGIGSIPVVEEEQVIGMLTDRDITIRSTARGESPDHTPVRDVMTPGILWVFEDQPVEEAAQFMDENNVKRLVVLNRERRVVGICSLIDVRPAPGTAPDVRL